MKKIIVVCLAGMVIATGACAQATPAPSKPQSVANAVSNLSPQDRARFEASVNAAGIKPAQIAGMDLEAAMMAVQSNRAKLLEEQLKGHVAEVQKKNAWIGTLNQVLAGLNKAASGFAADAKPNARVGDTAFRNNDYQLEKEINSVLMPANLRPFSVVNGDASSARGRTLTNAFYEGGIGGGTTRAQIDAAIRDLKTQIDAMSNSQQMDMLRLQSLTNKRNEAFDVMTNFIKKMQDSRSSIVGNMR